MLYVRADIPSNLLAFEDKPIESLFIELNLQNTKILINCSYNPHKSMVFHLRHHTHISKINLNIFGASISKWSFNFKIELLFWNGTQISKWSFDFEVDLRSQNQTSISNGATSPKKTFKKAPRFVYIPYIFYWITLCQFL